MKVREAISQLKNLKPNQYDDETLVGWLSELDGQIWQELLSHHHNTSAPLPYSRSDMDAQLLVQWPHEGLYITWLMAKVDYQNGEFERYNNDMMMFTMQMQAYADAYNRMHMPRQDACIRI